MSENEGAEADGPPDADDVAADSESGASSGDDAAANGAAADGAAVENGAVDDRATEDSTDEEPDGDVVPDDLVDRIEDTDPETLAEEIAGLRERAETAEKALVELEDEVEDLESRLKRKQAEFQNYKKRQEKRREEVRARATEDLVERLLEVRDNLARALEQDDDADIREGVDATFRLLDEVLADEDVEPIEPDPGTETDPKRHEVLLAVESDQPGGTVADVHRPGYEMAGKVLRPAQVTVADDAEELDGDDTGDEDE